MQQKLLKSMAESWEVCSKKLRIPEEDQDVVMVVFYAGAQAALSQVMKDVKEGEDGNAAFQRAIEDMHQALDPIIERKAARKSL